MKKASSILLLTGIFALLIIWSVNRRPLSAPPKNTAQAIGARGTGRIEKTLTEYQQALLEKHLLTPPVPSRLETAPASSGAAQQVHDVQQINKLNARSR